MLIVSFFSWWYGQGWANVAKSFQTRTQGVAASFSVSQLLRTLFEPWRKIISYPGASFQDKFRAWGDNMFSRAIGFVIRTIVLLTALFSTILIGIVTLIELALWPLLPALIPGSLIIGALL